MLRSREISKLKENIRKCKEYKEKIAQALGFLKLQYAASRITKQEYDSKLARSLEGKSLDYWDDYYDNLAEKYKDRILLTRKRQAYSLLIIILLAISVFGIINLGQFTTGKIAYNGASQQGYLNNGGNCNYGTVGLLVDTSTDDSVYFSQGPFNGAYTTFNWQTGRDIIYIDLGPIAEARSNINSLNITWNGRFSKTTGTGKPPTTVALAWYNWVTNAWNQFDTGIVSQSEKTSFLSITDPLIIQSIVSQETNGSVRLGFQALGTSTQCNSLVLTDLSSSAITISAKPTTSTTSTTTSSTSTTTSSSTSTSTSTTTTVATTTTSTTTSTTTTTSTILPFPPGQVLVTVAASIGISVDSVYSTSNFNTLTIGVADSTLDNVPLPILIRNEGSVPSDVQMSASNLWIGTSAVPSDYRFSIDVPDPNVFTLTSTGQAADSCSPLACFNAAGTILTAANMPISPALPANVINNLEFADTNDEAEINIYIHVPNDEPAGTKASTLTITGVDASTF